MNDFENNRIRFSIVEGFTFIWPNEFLKLNVSEKVFNCFDRYYRYMESEIDQFLKGTIAYKEVNSLETALVDLLDQYHKSVCGIWIPGEPHTLTLAPRNGQTILVEEVGSTIDMFVKQFKTDKKMMSGWTNFFNNRRKVCIEKSYHCIGINDEQNTLTGFFCSGKHPIDQKDFASTTDLIFPHE